MPEVTSVEDLAERLAALDPGRRAICAIAGAPGSGKSTLAERLVERLNRGQPRPRRPAAHGRLPLRRPPPRARGPAAAQGRARTFDVGGLRHMIGRLRANEEAAVAVPVFDRDIEIARAGARLIPSSVRVIVCEGNYLLLDRRPGTRSPALRRDGDDRGARGGAAPPPDPAVGGLQPDARRDALEARRQRPAQRAHGHGESAPADLVVRPED
jgi:pantothenate kinase